MAKEVLTKTLPLRNLTPYVDGIIRREQLRLEIEDGLRLKKPEVIFRIIKEWSETAPQQVQLTQ